MAPHDLMELQRLMEIYKQASDLGTLPVGIAAVVPPKPSELLIERARQLAQTSQDITDSVNDVVTQISISYASKLICLKPTTPELAKLYDDGLTYIAQALLGEAKVIEDMAKLEAEKEREAEVKAQQLLSDKSVDQSGDIN